MGNGSTLPVGSIIYESLLSPFIRFRQFLRDAGFFIISLYLLVIGVAATGMLFGALGVRGEGGPMLVLIAVLVAWGSLAIDFLVRWHRTLMSGGAETRSAFFPRFDGTHLRYFLYLLGIFLLAVVAVLVIALAAYALLSGSQMSMMDRTTTGYAVMTSFIRMGLTVILIAILGRFLLMLPIVATGGEEPFASATLLYHGNWLPVSLVLGGTSLIVMLFQFAFGMAVSAAAGSASLVPLFLGLQLLLLPLVIVLGIGIFASAVTMTYKQLAALRRVEPAAAE